MKENDETLKSLWIGGTVIDRDDQGNEVVEVRFGNALNIAIRESIGVFNPSDDREFTSLGTYIGENTHLTKLVHVDGRVGLDVEFLRRNTSIHKLSIACGGHDISAGAIHGILQVYQERTKNPTRLDAPSGLHSILFHHICK